MNNECQNIFTKIKKKYIGIGKRNDLHMHQHTVDHYAQHESRGIFTYFAEDKVLASGFTYAHMFPILKCLQEKSVTAKLNLTIFFDAFCLTFLETTISLSRCPQKVHC